MEAAAAPPPRQLTVGGVINEALDLYGKHAAVLLGTAFVVFTIAGVVQGILTDDHGFVLRFVASIVSIVASTLYTGFVVTLVADVRDGKRDFTVGELVSSASEAILRLIGNGILLAIAVGIGLLLLIVPGLYLLTIWAVVRPGDRRRAVRRDRGLWAQPRARPRPRVDSVRRDRGRLLDPDPWSGSSPRSSAPRSVTSPAGSSS